MNLNPESAPDGEGEGKGGMFPNCKKQKDAPYFSDRHQTSIMGLLSTEMAKKTILKEIFCFQ